jgi:hypothetical protein
MSVINFRTTISSFTIIVDDVTAGQWDKTKQSDNITTLEVVGNQMNITLNNPSYSLTILSTDTIQINGTEIAWDGSTIKNRILFIMSSSNFGQYIAIVSQSGTSAPTATIISNTLGSIPTWSYQGVGEYSLTGQPGDFPPSKTFLVVSNSTQPQYQYSFYNDDDGMTLGLSVIHNGTSSNDWLELMIKVEVYP